ncbi:extracellular serine/threonine protein CG31145-like isoform X2 [Uloborus diversus]|uniref:extracellular serine/threonine protein CG31145-like isoform X2 n=1 Tax=Uloborus diversus TaxID=327109 RepID=UPI00240A46EA|nr:extracellular serine/threonine protein CG31145-like isoform X2 [Uloborus diversus]
MKLKFRIIILSTLLALSILISAYFSLYLSTSTYSEPSNIMRFTNVKTPILDLDAVNHGRKTHKKARKKLRQDYTDSNRAVEVSPNENETVDVVLRNEKFRQSPVSLLEKESHQSNPKDACNYSLRYSQTDKREKFPDLVQFLPKRTATHDGNFPRKQKRITLQDIHGIIPEKNMTHLELFQLHISSVDLYAEDDENIDSLLYDMAKLPIVHVEQKEGGTQLKLTITYQEGSQAIFKPMRILGFRRCPPVVGRLLNITTEVYAITEEELIKTFFISPAGNICFHGFCTYYCDTGHAICGNPDTLEGSFCAMLPPSSIGKRRSHRHPWRRSYNKHRKAQWETDDDYCEEVVKPSPGFRFKRLADIVDMAVLDFLTGNMDRHHYETFRTFGNDSFIVHLDHGRGFGKSKHDETSILAPLYQCCFIRFQTFQTLLELHLSPVKLSDIMRCSLSKDPLRPILLEKHLLALDRRLETILRILKNCLQTNNNKDVFFYDTPTKENSYKRDD